MQATITNSYVLFQALLKNVHAAAPLGVRARLEHLADSEALNEWSQQRAAAVRHSCRQGVARYVRTRKWNGETRKKHTEGSRIPASRAALLKRFPTPSG